MGRRRKCARLYEIPRLANRHKRLNNGDAIERRYYFPSRTIYGQSSRDTTQRRHIDLVRSIVTLYNYANRLSLIKLVKATLGKQVSLSLSVGYSPSPRGHLDLVVVLRQPAVRFSVHRPRARTVKYSDKNIAVCEIRCKYDACFSRERYLKNVKCVREKQANKSKSTKRYQIRNIFF